MEKKKMWVASMAVVLASGTLLAACSSKEGNGTGQQAAEVKKDITVSVYDRGNVAQDEGTIENNRWTKWINEKGPANVKFVAIPRTNSQEKINVLFASGSAPDLLFEYAPNIKNPLYDQKQLMPLDSLIENSSVDYKKLLQENPVLKKAGTKADGKLYEFGRLNWVEPIRGLIIRTDWLKKLNLEMPKTTEDLYKVAKAFAEQDPDGNGKKDSYGIALSSSSEATINQIFQASQKWDVKDGQLGINWEQSKDLNAFKKKLYDEGIIDKDFINDKNGAKAKQDFINGKVGIYPFLGVNSTDMILSMIDPLKKNVATATVAYMPYPKSPFGQFIPTLQNPIQMTAVVNATAKNPDAVMKYVDFISRNTTLDTLTNGNEGEHHKVVDGCLEVIDKDKMKKQVSDVTGDMRMLENSGLRFDKCSIPIVKYKSDPRKQEYQDFYQSLRDTYLTFDKPYAELTHSEHMPQPPKELALIQTNADKAISDIWTKALVSGEKYTIDQALKDAKDAWEKAGGKQVEDWYKNWYINEKDKAVLAKDIIEVAKKQDEQYKKLLKELK
ncbi:extracellular solute-binding protein [Paenibacillus sp. WQ 127069]|uniref:Extracellular solute-binding protein n=1 Tax=Paenibacillus baimaensis TaxID=2982185 RepID=A0ABT2UAY5_9BACL|nr:extracellular solute-binding protein [Paenibacillus sp. WQ 127069]MCU6791803.1 extracellular solute-binding protein [Paenibacillus sp. WQ 127069]